MLVVVLRGISCPQTKNIEIKKGECYNYNIRIYLLLDLD